MVPSLWRPRIGDLLCGVGLLGILLAIDAYPFALPFAFHVAIWYAGNAMAPWLLGWACGVLFRATLGLWPRLRRMARFGLAVASMGAVVSLLAATICMVGGSGRYIPLLGHVFLSFAGLAAILSTLAFASLQAPVDKRDEYGEPTGSE